MIAQLALSALLGAVLLYAFTVRRRAPVIMLGAAGTALAALWFVWVPGHATTLARWAGIGRGVDLILYLWVVISLIIMLSLHLKLRAQMELITQLARRIALNDAERRNDPVTTPAAGASPPSQ